MVVLSIRAVESSLLILVAIGMAMRLYAKHNNKKVLGVVIVLLVLTRGLLKLYDSQTQ